MLQPPPSNRYTKVETEDTAKPNGLIILFYKIN